VNGLGPAAEGGEPGFLQRSNLALRILTAVVGLPLVAALAYLGGWPFAIAAGVVILLASIEFVHGWLFPSMPMRAAMGLAPSFGAAGMMAGGVHSSNSYLWLGIAIAALLGAVGYSHTNRFGPRRPFRVMSWCLAYCGVLGATLVLVRDLPGGRDWFFLAILSAFAVDTGAYAVGRAIGRHKLAPKISPKKTVEGAIGGLVAGIAAVLALNALLDTDVSLLKVLPLALLLPIAGQAGDLFESWMKRRMGVKDASGLLPGHGGFLDRLDSVLVVMPVAWLYLRWVVV
jgi:phosphatidate cytidylyltransferase